MIILSSRGSLIVIFYYLINCMFYLTSSYTTCPSSDLLSSLYTSSESYNLNSYSEQDKIRCDCTKIPTLGWEIECFLTTIDEQNQVNKHYLAMPVAFTIKYEFNKYIEIECFESSPNFSPAMFQGFNVDEIDSFKLKNCPLPDIPFHVIFHRTSISTKNGGNNKQIINRNLGNNIKTIRSLNLQSNNVINIDLKRLKDLFYGLSKLEILYFENIQLTLSNSRIKRNSKSNSSKISSSEATSFTSDDNKSSIFIQSVSSNGSNNKTNNNHNNHKSNYKSNIYIHENISKSDELILNNEPKTIHFIESSEHLIDIPKDAPLNNENFHLVDEKSIRTVEKRKNGNIITMPATPSGNINLDFSFGSYFPNLKSLVLYSFLKSDSLENHFILKKLLNNLHKLEILTMKDNIISYLPEDFFNESCSSLKRIYLFNNSIDNIHENAFVGCSNLEILDLINNRIKSIPNRLFKNMKNLRNVRIKNNAFTSLPRNLFINNTNLLVIDLSTNFNLSKPLANDFLNGAINLKNFSMNDCNNTNLISNWVEFFSHSPKLEDIDLRNCYIFNCTQPRMFGINPKLEHLDLSYNNIHTIDSSVFTENSSYLLHLNLYGNELTYIPKDLFHHLKKLRILNLGFNNLKNISENMFYSLDELEVLDLSKNQLLSINPSRGKIPFGLAVKLEVIKLSQNKLTKFNEEFGVINWSLLLVLEKLDLSGNMIEGSVEIPLFYSSKPKMILDLRRNKISSIDISSLKNFVDIANADSEVLSSSQSELEIRIANNSFICDCNLYPLFNYTSIEISSRDAHKYKRVSFDFSSNMLKCAGPPFLEDKPFYNVSPSDLLCSLNGSRFCPEECECWYQPDEEAIIVDCKQKGLSEAPKRLIDIENYANIEFGKAINIPTVKGITLQLQHNDIKDIEPFTRLINSTRKNEKMLKTKSEPISIELYLDNNTIESINDNLTIGKNTTNMAVIRLLSLRYNNIHYIPIGFLDELRESSLSRSEERFKLYLGNNPYNCTPEGPCIMREFKSWITGNYRLVGDISDIFCNSTKYILNSSALIDVPDSVLCPQNEIENQGLLLTLTGLCVIFALALFLVSIMYYRNKQTLLAFFYIHFHPVFVCLLSEEDIDGDKVYDAFVSYSSGDRDVVMELIEKLEGNGNGTCEYLASQSGLPSVHEGVTDSIVPEIDPEIKMNGKRDWEMEKKDKGNKDMEGDVENKGMQDYFKLCIHERDWLPGNLISWNIVNSVQNSRRTILVLSKDFISSIWFQVEFHTAYYQMLEDKIDRLIVIVRGELPPKEELDKDLVFLLTTKTYLVWGEKWFWEKLRYAMPHRRKKNEKKRMCKKQAKGKMTKSDVMREYVDQTIANHFQLNQAKGINSYFTNNSKEEIGEEPIINGSSMNGINGHNLDNLVNTEGSPYKTKMEASVNRTNNPDGTPKSGHVNKSFVIETQT